MNKKVVNKRIRRAPQVSISAAAAPDLKEISKKRKNNNNKKK